MIARALVLRPIAREKARTALTVAGIAVGVAVVVAIQLANQSALRAFRQSVDAVAGRANYQIVPDVAPLDERILLRLQPLWSKGVRFAPVIDVEGMLDVNCEGTPRPAGCTRQPIRLLAVDLLSDLHFRDYRYAKIDVGAQGNSGVNAYFSLFQPDAVILPAPFAREHGLSLGSRVTLDILAHRRSLIVRGILEAKGPATAFNGAIAVCDVATAQRNFGMTGRLSRIDILVPDDNRALLDRIALPPGVRIERPSRRNERVEKMIRAFRVNLFALAGVALLVGVFLVYNTVLISILRRRRDVGILKTLGTSPRQIFIAFATEGLVFGVVGSVLGIALGYGLAGAILRVVGRTINTLYVASQPEAVTLTPQVIAMGMAVGTILSLVSALQPSIEAARVRPNTLVRAGLQQRIASRRVLTAGAVASFVVGALVSRIPPVGGIPVAGYASVLFVVLGFSLLAPMIVSGTSLLLRPLLSRLFGVIGTLAAATLPASLRRTSVASAALSLATGMMIAVAVMVGSFRETVRIWVDQTVSSDLWLRPSKGLSNAQTALFPPVVGDEAARVPFVAGVDRVRGREILYRDQLISLGSGDFAAAARFGDLPMITPHSAAAALHEGLRRKGVVVSESFSLKFDKGVGDEIELPTRRGVAHLPITGVYRDYSSDRGVIFMDRALYVDEFGDDAINTIVLYLKPGVDRNTARRSLERMFGERYGAFVVTNAEVRTQVMKIFDQTFLITYALLGVAIVVAVLGIINTLSALILERRRELALLRVAGMTVRELRTMLVLESSLLGAASTAAGLVMGYVLSWILIYVINKQSFGWTIEFHTPVALVAASLAVTLGSATLAGLVPARTAQRIELASAIKAE